MESRVLFVVGTAIASRNLFTQQVADHLAQFQTWNLREIKNHSGLVPRFAELTQLQTFAKQKAILAKQKYFKRM
jgi:hypothetical protein